MRILNTILENLPNKLFRSSHRRCSLKKCVLKNFAKFAEKHMCESLFLNKVADSGLQLD